MEKFSVKKPMTVFVVVVLIGILGTISLSKMTPDLLPNIDMPFVVVMTPSVGSTPEKVELNVTKPLEQSLATLDKIKNVNSISNGNYSLLMLEFNNDVNMDTVSVDILQKINTVEGGFDENVGTPTLIKMNPSMIPIATAAVVYEGKDQVELSAFVKNTLNYELEGIDGVANIIKGGILEEKVNVVINQKKIDKINNQVLASINSELSQATNELNNGKKQLKKALSDINYKKEQLKTGQTVMPMPSEQYEEALENLETAEKEINDKIVTLEEQEKTLEIKGNEARHRANIGDKITIEMVSGILKAQNFQMPAGYVYDDGVKYLVSLGDVIKSEKGVKNLFLFNIDAGNVGDVKLGDVADVFVDDNREDVYANIDGKSGIVLSFSKQSNVATSLVAKDIKYEFTKLEEKYEGLEFISLMNQGDYINLVVASIVESLLWGAFFASIILFVFLRNIKPTFITVVSIPISIVFSLVLMYFSGVTLNLISLSGLAVSVGMLVDNSVVVIENTYRLRRLGISAPKAAIAGAKQVAGAITASTLTTIAIFVPIVFTDGVTRQLFSDMGLTIAYSLIASLIIALTLVPAMASKLLVDVKEHKEKNMTKLAVWYKRAISFALGHKALVLALALALFGYSLITTLSKGFIFMPEMNSPQISVSLEMPKGTSLEETRRESDEVIEIIKNINHVKNVGAILSGGSMMGMSGGDNGEVTQVSIYVMLDETEKFSSSEISKEIEKKCNRENFTGSVTASGSSMSDFTSGLGGEGISIKISGSDLKIIEKNAVEVANELTKIEGIEESFNGVEETDDELHFVVNKTKAMKKGVTVAQVYAALVEAMKVEENSTNVTWKGDNYDVCVSSDKKAAIDSNDVNDLDLQIKMEDGTFNSIKLKDLATLRETKTLSSINRSNQERYLTVTATIAEGYNITNVTEAAQKAVDKLDLSEEIEVEFLGELKTIIDSMEDLMLMMIVGIAFVYLIMVAQFQSLKSPLIIMFTIPLAITGGLLALLITRQELSVIAMIGFVMLSGIIVNNGIVLVDYINQLREKNLSKREAIIEAGITRMRPIFMTSLTTILGLTVTALGAEAGTDMMKPMAVVCIGGLVYATILTLFVVPVVYDIMNKEEYHYYKEEDLDIRNI